LGPEGRSETVVSIFSSNLLHPSRLSVSTFSFRLT
jgi:hypothetical protein